MAAEDPLQHVELPLLYEKRVPHTTLPDLAAYCDAHDLIALVCDSSPTLEQEIVVYRLNGQIAFKINGRSGDANVNAMKWKADGTLLGIGWTDGLCGVYSGEDGKLLSQTSVILEKGENDWRLDLAPGFGKVVQTETDVEDADRIEAVIGWTEYDRPLKASTARPVYGQLPSTTDDLFDSTHNELQGQHNDENGRSKEGISDLVNTITAVDITKAFPKLSAIPSHGARAGPDGNKFATQAGVDSIFETKKADLNTIDTLITSGNAGFTNVLVDESVMIGSFDLHCRPLVHASHPQCTSQVILSDSAHDEKFRLHYFDLPLENLGSSLLHVIAANTKRLQDLISYIAQTVRCIQHDYLTGLQFPSRLMNSVRGELADKEEGDMISNFYHLAITGSFTPTMLEWLTDTVKETQHKRWDQAITTMYTNIRDHLFINLLPALDRLAIAASTLRGHARLHEGTSQFDVSPVVFTRLFDDVDSLRLVAQKMLLVAMAEYKQFRAFSKWLRVMIEVGMAGPGTKGAIEVEEREIPNLDYGLILAYIKDTLNLSKLAIHLEPLPGMKSSCPKENFFMHPAIVILSRQNTMKALEYLDLPQVLDHRDDSSATAVLNLPGLTVRLRGQVRLATESITSWQSKMLPHPTTTPLITPLEIVADATILDLRMFPHGNHLKSVTYLLTTSPRNRRSNKLNLCTIIRFKESKEYDFSEANFKILRGEVLCAKLLDEKRCMVLFTHDDGRHLLLVCDLGAYEVDRTRWLKVLHVFESTSSFVPNRFVIGGRQRKMVCVVFNKTGKCWKIFDLDGIGVRDLGKLGTEDMQV